MRHRGFTLLEVMAVIVVLGLLTTGAVLKLMPMLGDARWEDVVKQVEEADASARLVAMQSGKENVLVYETQKGRIYRLHDGSAMPIAETFVARTFSLTQIRVRGRSERLADARLRMTREGYSPTYAVQVRRGDAEAQWIVFAGRSGQTKRLDRETDVTALFDILDANPTGDDAR